VRFKSFPKETPQTCYAPRAFSHQKKVLFFLYWFHQGKPICISPLFFVYVHKKKLGLYLSKNLFSVLKTKTLTNNSKYKTLLKTQKLFSYSYHIRIIFKNKKKKKLPKHINKHILRFFNSVNQTWLNPKYI
jgi:galactose-1-phosphate uridylyltransferase